MKKKVEKCAHCRFPLPEDGRGLRFYGTHTAHAESECLRLLHAEIARLRAEIESLRAELDAAHDWQCP